MDKENSDTSSQESAARIWGMLCHLTALLGMVGIPFGNIIGPLVIWLYKRNAYANVLVHGKESLNFQLTMTILVLIAALLIYVRIGMMLIFVLASINAVLVVIASVQAYRGESYHYPFQIRFIK